MMPKVPKPHDRFFRRGYLSPVPVGNVMDPRTKLGGGGFDTRVARTDHPHNATHNNQIAFTDLTGTSSLPLGTLGYASVTANQTGITTETDLTSLTLTVTITAGRRIRISYSTLIRSTVAADTGSVALKEGATQLRSTLAPALGTGAPDVRADGSLVLTPSAGSHTYKLTLARNSGTGTLSLIAGATDPAELLIEDIGV